MQGKKRRKRHASLDLVRSLATSVSLQPSSMKLSHCRWVPEQQCSGILHMHLLQSAKEYLSLSQQNPEGPANHMRFNLHLTDYRNIMPEMNVCIALGAWLYWCFRDEGTESLLRRVASAIKGNEKHVIAHHLQSCKALFLQHHPSTLSRIEERNRYTSCFLLLCFHAN